MRALSRCLSQLSRETLPSALFPHPPLIRFAPKRNMCHCGGRLVVQKTRRKTVLRMTGPFIAHETMLQCRSCSRSFGSDDLLRLVTSHCNVGYDVLIFVGRALLQRHHTAQEVRAELAARDVRLSVSEVEHLGRKFVTYLAMGHRLASPRLRQTMTLAGGYVLHLDATHEGDAPALMTGMDGLSEIVLANVKIPTEHAEHIAPFLQKLRQNYGNPAACVHDMGTGICKAVAEIFPGIPDVVCHFHFLRDIGKDFLDPAYRELRNSLRAHATSSRLHALAREARQGLSEQSAGSASLAKAIKAADLPNDSVQSSLDGDKQFLPCASTYSLALWCLQGKHSGDGYGFPFDRPLLVFAERLLELNLRLPEVLALIPATDQGNCQSLFKLARVAAAVADDAALCHAVEELRWRSQVFDRLRTQMRIALPGGKNGLNDDGAAETMVTIRQCVALFRRELDEDRKLSTDQLSRNMAKQIDKYGDKLFADPIETTTPTGTVTIYPQRTNNILEQFFRGVRRGQRRKTGNDSMHRVVQTMLADTPLVKNLNNPVYMKILLDGKENLEELFAVLGAAPPTGTTGSQPDSERLLPGFRVLINLQTLPEHMVRLFTNNTR